MGYALDARMTENLVMQALFRAVAAKRPGKELIHHSDRGSQYCAQAYQKLLRQFGMQVSMSRKGNCRDTPHGKLPGFPEDRTDTSPPFRYSGTGQMRDHGVRRNPLRTEGSPLGGQPDSKAGTTRPSVARRFKSEILCNADGRLIPWTLRFATALKGELSVRHQLIVHATGRVSGKIRYGKLVIDEGGELCGDINTVSEKTLPPKLRSKNTPALSAVDG